MISGHGPWLGTSVGSQAGALRVENHFCCQQQFLFFPLAGKGIQNKRGRGGTGTTRPLRAVGSCISRALCPFPCTVGMPEWAVHCVPVPAGCCSSAGNAPEVHIPSTSCRNPSLPIPHGGSRARQCYRHGWQQGERSRVESGSFWVLGPRGGVTPPLVTLSS